jgi:hypothetical protein
VEDPADVLIRVSENLDLLICGSRGYGPLPAVLLGGVSRRLTAEARCSVIVLPRGVKASLDALMEASRGAAAGLAIRHARAGPLQSICDPLEAAAPRGEWRHTLSIGDVHVCAGVEQHPHDALIRPLARRPSRRPRRRIGGRRPLGRPRSG